MDDKKNKPNLFVNTDKGEFANLKQDELIRSQLLSSFLKDDPWLDDNLKTANNPDKSTLSIIDINGEIIKKNELFKPYITVEFPNDEKEEIITIHRPRKNLVK
jgi:hypothetical protein